MTLGKKLSNYRKLADLTQQQLGDYLNLSAQAVSKWENDLAEPDLATLRSLATLYKVSLDELIDLSGEAQPVIASAGTHGIDSDVIADAVSTVIDERMKSTPETIGYCKVCGIAVTGGNLGVREPVVKCKNCLEAERIAERRQKEKKAREEAERRKQEVKERERAIYVIEAKRKKSLIVASIITGIYLIAFIYVLATQLDPSYIISGIILGYAIFSFVASLFYDTPVINVIEYMCTASIKWPGLIFTWDLDGILWLIGMKLLFAALGFIFGLFCAALGLALGLLIAPFVFPYVLHKINRDIADVKAGKAVDLDY
ncbi:MAG: helix-turn-helix domain-containing protein [Clostridia bacterium]|nr:helix-turn-helix domain-containing protein [Clostridia bacterium]